MSDKRTSREIIWQHAFDYRWERRAEVRGDPGCDIVRPKRSDRYTRSDGDRALRSAPSGPLGVVGSADSPNQPGEAK